MLFYRYLCATTRTLTYLTWDYYNGDNLAIFRKKRHIYPRRNITRHNITRQIFSAILWLILGLNQNFMLLNGFITYSYIILATLMCWESKNNALINSI